MEKAGSVQSQSAVSPEGGLEVLLRRKAEKISDLRKCLRFSHIFVLSSDQKPLNTSDNSSRKLKA